MAGPIFTGFNFQRPQDPTKSAKDTFGAAAQASGQMPTNHADAAAWFSQYAQPALEAQGYKVYEVQGDKARVGTREDPAGSNWVDFLQNSGGSNPAFQWHLDAVPEAAIAQALSAPSPLDPGLGQFNSTAIQQALGEGTRSPGKIGPLSRNAGEGEVVGVTPMGTIPPLNRQALSQGLQGLKKALGGLF